MQMCIVLAALIIPIYIIMYFCIIELLPNENGIFVDFIAPWRP